MRPTEYEKRGRSLEGWINLLLVKHSLAYVNINAGPHGFTARAVPDTFNPTVASRREKAFANAGETITLERATEITNNALAPVATGRGANLGDALAELEGALKAA